MKKSVFFILIFFIIQLLLSDIGRGYSFLETAKKADLIALVKVINKYHHGYLCKISEIIYSKEEINKDKIVIWGDNNFDFTQENINIPNKGDDLFGKQFLVAVFYIKKI